ncbi:MAG: YvcK family protein [Anaerolineales bacterium]|nr:YvcK family protein [Anaerolineales bacterium]
MDKTRSGWSWLQSRLRWLRPGLGVKRWLLLLAAGATLVGLGAAFLVLDLSRPGPAFTWRWLLLGRAALLGGLGLVCILVAVAQTQRVLLAPFVQPGQDVASAVSEHRRKGRGPKLVAIGGGTGLSTLLRGLKAHTANLTAIVTVADDGGSSGRLRQTLGVLPPGDFRNCLAALADDEALTTQLFQYRFGGDEGLGGHSFGNLFISAMTEVVGSFERALVESSRVLAIRGQVLPSTLRNVTLVGELAVEGAAVSRVEGESRIPLASGAIQRVYLQPEDVPAYPAAIKALLEADLIVLGPGSLYTSLLPNLLVPDLAAAIAASRALKVYVSNTATQPGETGGYTVLDHVQAIERHTQPGLFPVVLANNRQQGRLLPRLEWVSVDPPVNGTRRLVLADLADPERPWRHDSAKTAAALMHLLTQAEAERALAV